MRTDVLAELKGLRLHGMAQAWVERKRSINPALEQRLVT